MKVKQKDCTTYFKYTDKLYKIIFVLSVMSLVYDLFDSIFAASLIGWVHLPGLFLSSLDYVLFFLLLLFFSKRRSARFMFLTLVVFLAWSQVFDYPSVYMWALNAFPDQVLNYQSPYFLLSGVFAGVFILMVFLILFLVVLELKRKFYKKSGG